MKELNPEKLVVEFRPGVTGTEPVLGRKYTLTTHAGEMADLNLTVGRQYAYDKINKKRDEILTEWKMYDGAVVLYGYVYVDGLFGPEVAAARDSVFRHELPLALEAVRYGDSKIFEENPQLDNAQIWIYFDSTNPGYIRFEKWGSPKDYK